MNRILLLAAVLLCSCSQNLIQDKATRADVAKRIDERKTWIPAISSEATPVEKEALEFIYAYMPVGDAADFSAELYLRNVRSTLRAKAELKWQVPENIFLHFVLPVRVNNENLDTSREDFYAELRDRVKDLTMMQAILEVNHWCHEKVVYTPSDSRTSAPSATVRSATGRCGEESTFTVAALRSVGIPARQVYTPRWAHSDDNHAWVEAWADGKWYYMGACEPEPVLNTGWFDAPAARAMLMHTKVYGNYNGPEEVINRTECYTEINVTENYATVAQIEIQVVDSEGKPISGANVDYGIYNYAEFFPAARKVADEKGVSSISAGLGTMVVWANDGTNYGFTEVTFGRDKVVKVTLNNASGEYAMDVVPPIEKAVTRDITPEQRADNNRRLAAEDSIRNAYTATFAKQADGEALAREVGADPERVAKLIIASKGNHAEISKFLRETPSEQITTAIDLLEVIAPKDLRDTPASVLRDHLSGSIAYSGEPNFKENILNPRIGMELLTPYRARLSQVGGCSTAQEIIATTHDIKVVPELNPAKLRITPMAVHSLRMADKSALNIYTIALLRSKGIAARFEPITENPQYFEKSTSKWVNITTNAVAEKGTLSLSYKGSESPKYETHFTLARLEQGAFRTLELASDILSSGSIPLEYGTYRLTSGTRMADGSVLAEVKIFEVKAGETTTQELVMRQDLSRIKVIGSMNPESLFVTAGSDQPGSILATTGRGYFVLALVGAKQEPTNHAMRDLAAERDYFEKWGRRIVLVFRDSEQFKQFDAKEFGTLPSTITLGYDNQGQTAKMVGELMAQMKIAPNMDNLPIFVIADTFGRVVYFSQGYKIGLGEQLKKVIEKL